MTGSGGSGILIARKSDGTWSPPSGIMLHTPTLSFIIGVDVYDCVLVMNNLAALESITRPRVTLGEDVGLTNGPLVPLDSDELHINWRELGNTVLAYMKARGQHQAVKLHGCILAERANENERFYESSPTQMDILAGNVGRHVEEAKPLFEVIKMAEGRTDFDAAVIGSIAFHSAPGDAEIATPKSTCSSPRPSFGIPKADDPDPFGVLALEMAGLEIREAGSRPRPTSSQLEHASIPLSPSMSKFCRQSIETYATRSNRVSVMSSRTTKSQATDAYVRTDAVNTPGTTPSPSLSDDGQARASIDRMPKVKEDDEVDYTKVDLSPLRSLSHKHSIGAVLAAVGPTTGPGPNTVPATSDHANENMASQDSSAYAKDDSDEETNDADDEDDLGDDEEEPVVIEVAAVQPTSARAVASRVVQARGNVVTIPKRLPPPLPKRSPARNPRSDKTEPDATAPGAKGPLRQPGDSTGTKADDGDDPDSSSGTKSTRADVERSMVTESEADADKVVEALAEEPEAGKNLAEHRVSGPPRTGNDAPVEAHVEKESEEVLPGGELEATQEETGSIETQLTIKAHGLAERKQDKAGETRDGEHDDKTKEKDGLEAALQKAERNEDAMLHGSGHEQTDNSDSTTHEKHTSSIYTGATEDRWSCDGSSVTTPTSERRFSMPGGDVEGDTPAKSIKEEGVAHAAAQQLRSGPEKAVTDSISTACALSTTT